MIPFITPRNYRKVHFEQLLGRFRFFLRPTTDHRGVRRLQCIEHVAARIRAVHYDVLLFGAGLAGVIPIVDEWRRHPERTYIHMGSAFDPLFKGRTRSGQLSTYQARAFLREVIH